MSSYLEFEQPIIDLEKSIQRYQDYCRKNHLDTCVADELTKRCLPRYRDCIFDNLTAWEKVQLSRHPERPYPKDLASYIFTDFLELHGDRRYSDDHAIIGGFAKLEGRPVMLLMTQKGRNLAQNIKCNFGSGHPEGYRKALRLMKMANKAGCPVICLVDTAGAYPGIGAEERHIGEAIAENLRDAFALTVPVISVITGEGGSGGALALAIANSLLIMQYAYFSVITPEGCSAILWRSESEVARAAQALKLTSNDLFELGVADQIVPEPAGGAHRNWAEAAQLLKSAIQKQLDRFDSMRPEEIQAARYEKFRAIGSIAEPADAHQLTIRKPDESEISRIHAFLQPFVQKKQILERTEDAIREQLDSFLVALDAEEKIIGTISLRDFGDGLNEIRTLAVSESQEGQGIGSQLVKASLEMARSRNAKCVFTLTMKPRLFQRLGFSQVSIMRFPNKIQHDCEKCKKRSSCDETALRKEL